MSRSYRYTHFYTKFLLSNIGLRFFIITGTIHYSSLHCIGYYSSSFLLVMASSSFSFFFFSFISSSSFSIFFASSKSKILKSSNLFCILRSGAYLPSYKSFRTNTSSTEIGNRIFQTKIFHLGGRKYSYLQDYRRARIPGPRGTA